MSHAKRRRRRKAVTVLGVAGALSLAGGTSEAAVGPVGSPAENTASVITLGEEEISDVSLATFYVFDNENAGAHRSRLTTCQEEDTRPRRLRGPPRLRRVRRLRRRRCPDGQRRAGWAVGR
jgi:hypothetical protein